MQSDKGELMKVIVNSYSKNSCIDIDVPGVACIASVFEYMTSFDNVIRYVFIYGTMKELCDRVQVDEKTLLVRYKIGSENTRTFNHVNWRRFSKCIQTFVDASIDSFNHSLSFVKQSPVST
jgi:hypothetical protein